MKHKDRVPRCYDNHSEDEDRDEKDITEIINVNTPPRMLLSVCRESMAEALLRYTRLSNLYPLLTPFRPFKRNRILAMHNALDMQKSRQKRLNMDEPPRLLHGKRILETLPEAS